MQLNLHWTIDIHPAGNVSEEHFFFDGHEITPGEYCTIQDEARARAIDSKADIAVTWEDEWAEQELALILSHEELERS